MTSTGVMAHVVLARDRAADDGATEYDTYAQRQADAQAVGRGYNAGLTLDFSSFEAALDELTPARRDELDVLVRAEVSQVRAMLASGRTTSAELVTYYVDRVRRLDAGRYSTILELNPDAPAIAAELDAERAAGAERGPLHGVVVTIKGNIATGDRMHTTAGAAVMADAVADRDAFLVARLREAGAVVLGKNAMSEWANFYGARSVNGFSALGGFTRHPFGDFDVGGSSSGPCAAVALGLTLLAVGTETTGSIVHPASQNAVVALKPSVGLVSRDRIIPISSAFDTAGPIGRHVTDVAILMTALAAQADPGDPAFPRATSLNGVDFTAGLSADALRGVRVGVVARGEEKRHGDDLIRLLAVSRLEAAGAQVVSVPPMSEFAGDETHERLSRDSDAVMLRGFRIEVERYLAAQGERVPVRTLSDIVSYNNEDSESRVPLGQEYIVAASQLSDEELAGYPELADRTKNAYARLVNDALAAHDVAFMVDLSNYASEYHSRSGFAALTMPAGRRRSGEPAGVTFFGGWLSDADLLRYGYAYEAGSGVDAWAAEGERMRRITRASGAP